MFPKASETQDVAINPSGRILIKSFDGKSIINCYKVISSPIINAKSDEPKYMLMGIDGLSFWGENSTFLGWYASEENIKKEIESITTALKIGKVTYELKYASNIKQTFWSFKLEE